jgi:hypothetical protein
LNFAVMGSVILLGVLADQQFARYRKRRLLHSAQERAVPRRLERKQQP